MYPLPALVIVTAVTAPPETVAVPVAVIPLVGALNVTVGAEEYPVPPAVTVALATELSS